ncbi:probable ATP-dependent RNA helicase DDX20 [Corythoichthys intestinalis]|uniref:probable ATP-dependent RNA helicase DDX20 n=1 Tax=Corythoichthys intestinalis TaxID=161448 RepID=UPI0025A689B9|nr:probable ATP-dependent RNA helicase DDX20 [Corythoichthys intestinalis]XP_061802313.1 probable ATP-dependent RNA helicase DDX20 [Nerophis lumbriciformis]
MAASTRKAAHDIERRNRTDDVILADGIDFTSLLLSEVVLDGLSAAGFQKPSPIQFKAIPLGRCGLDLIVQAKSGTGKTCVFCTIALDSLILENPATQVLVLAPTREIAVQIHSVVMAIGCAMEGLQCHVFIGGRPVSQDKLHLKKCHIAVGSPGRIKQLIELGILSTASIRLFVLDEADKLLEEGSFQEQINWIFSSLPENKQMLALSATYPESLAQHLTRYMSEPTFVRLNPRDMGLKGLRQYYKLVQSHPLPHKVFEEKVQNLLELFSKIPFNQALVFSNLHTRAQHLADILSSKGLPAVCISGSLSQEQRLTAMSKLKQYQCRVLISTDLTSRGIDAEKVNLVINLDVPQDWETYMHRIGRAGRFGTQGLAVTYCCHGEEENKMLAIAQKCGLSLSILPSTIDAGLMTEQCDWDVCVEASTAVLQAQPFLTNEKKKVHAKVVSPIIKEESQEAGKPKMSQKLVSLGVEGLSERANPSTNILQSPSKAAPTRKELQDALPKIPPLSSFKNCTSVFMTFEEAERDFQSFITTGLGRSVEIVRDFMGQGDCGDHNEQREFVTLDDDGSEICHGWKSEHNPAKSTPSSSSSENDAEDHPDCQFSTTVASESTTVTNTQMEVNHRCSVSQPQMEPFSSEAPITFQMKNEISNKISPPPDSYKSVIGIEAGMQTKPMSAAKSTTKNQKTKVKMKKLCRKKSETIRKDENYETEGDKYCMEDDYFSTESYWRECYRAWNDYYASMSPFLEQNYEGYSAAHNWMAAYRMNTVYVEELLKR